MQKFEHALFQRLRAHFKDDLQKTFEWFKKPNQNLGMLKPNDLIECNRADKLMKYITEKLNKGITP